MEVKPLNSDSTALGCLIAHRPITSQRRVIVVDDDPMLLTAMARVLALAGFAVDTAGNAEDALAHARQFALDAAVVDFGLPDQDGLQLLEQLRVLQPSCVRILASGQIDLNVAVNAVNLARVARVITKPYPPQTLVAVVAKAVDEEQQRQSIVDVEAGACARARKEMLKECLAGDDIQLALQPIVCAITRAPHAFEALLRSTHTELNNPAKVLAVAEEQGCIEDLADVVWARARRWMQEIPGTATRLFLNLHPLELDSPERLSKRASMLAPWAHRIVIELTEQSSVMRGAHWREALAVLTELGFEIAIDDLGSGYNSLSLLAELQPQFIKLDMGIVRDIHNSPRKQRLVSLLCRFADASGAQIVAEGIEEQAEADMVTSLGAHLLQGYLIARPTQVREALFGDRNSVPKA